MQVNTNFELQIKLRNKLLSKQRKKQRKALDTGDNTFLDMLRDDIDKVRGTDENNSKVKKMQ